jgi:nucleotide-binding universal stress UspA family protein
MHLLVLTDFSPAADQALAVAVLLAGAVPDAQLTLLHVRRTSLLDPGYFSTATRSEADAAHLLAERCARATAQRVACTPLVEAGRVVPVVRAVAERLGIDLLVTSKCDTEATPDELVDSVSLDLLRTVSVPLLVVPERYRAPALPRHALFPIDGSPVQISAAAARVSHALLATGPATLTALLVTSQTASDEVRRAAEVAVRASGLTEGETPLTTIQAAEPADGILRGATHADLLMLVARQHGVVGSLLHYSVTAQVLRHTRVPVLLLPEVGA